MSRSRLRIALFVALLGGAAVPRVWAGSEAETATRIRRVEEGLLPSIAALVKNQDVKPATIADRMKALGVPGASVAVIDGGKVAWAKGYGVREAGKPDPVTPETLFQAASISKPVTALAALKLVQDRKLDLDADVNTVLKSWKVPDSPHLAREKVTLRRLLSHSAGFADRFGFPGYPVGVPRPSLPQVLDGQPPANTAPKAVRVADVPGVKFRYSGGGYVVVQLMIEDVTGRPFAPVLRETVLDPLGMDRSTFEQPLPDNRAGEAATGHYAGLQKLVKGPTVKGRWHVYPEQAPAGLWTTPTDLARFAIEIQKAHAGESDKVLSKPMADAMLTPQPGGWGLGFGLGGEGDAARFDHSGSNEGFICLLVAFKGSGRGAVIMTNSSSGFPLCMEILKSIAAEYRWPAVTP